MNCKFVAGFLAILLTSTSGVCADDGAGLFKKKCAGCHGVDGEGKPTMKAPALKGTNLEAGAIATHITKGESGSKAPHNKGISGLTDAQAQMIAEYVKTLK